METQEIAQSVTRKHALAAALGTLTFVIVGEGGEVLPGVLDAERFANLIAPAEAGRLMPNPQRRTRPRHRR